VENDLEIPIFSYEDIRKYADVFLKQYHPTSGIPVPIEEIAEFQMDIDIIPIPGLLRAFDVDGFTSSDLSNIYVDEFIYNDRPRRYRFTLAHEIGHIILHKENYLQAIFHNIKEWKVFINSISAKDHGWLEYQAYSFGGLVLVPHEHLVNLTKICVNHVKKEDISLQENWDFAWEMIAAQLAKTFDVSSTVIEKRLSKDNIQEQYTLK
jgi:hypothetical protein|tara:strand:+ start:252 stop:875 length:624 start_codon:yes stop_codon:yes gene_type:complete